MPRHPRVAPTAAGLSHDVYSALVERARGRPGPVHPLHVGDTWLEPLPAARAEAQRSADHPRLHGYAPVQGEPALLDAIRRRLASRHGARRRSRAASRSCPARRPASPSCVHALLAPGDELRRAVAVLAAHPRHRDRPRLLPVEVPFFTRLGEPDFDAEAALERAIGPRTAAIYVNAPNNPTGRLLPDAAADAIASVARRHDLWVIADEAYEELVYEGEHRPLWRRPSSPDGRGHAHALEEPRARRRARRLHARPAEAMRAVRARPVPRELLRRAADAARGGAGARDGRRVARGDAGRVRRRGRAAAAAVGVPPPEAGTFLFFDAAPHFARGERLDGFLERCLDAGVLLTPGPACGRDFDGVGAALLHRGGPRRARGRARAARVGPPARLSGGGPVA